MNIEGIENEQQKITLPTTKAVHICLHELLLYLLQYAIKRQKESA